MNIYLSKVILSGIIASSFMTMSCQKRGTRPSAKLVGGVENTVQKSAEQKLPDLPDIANEAPQTQPEVKTNETTPPAQATSKDNSAPVAETKEETATNTEEEEITPLVIKPAGLIVNNKEETKEDVKDEKNDETKTVVEAKTETKATAKSNDKTCSEATISKSNELSAEHSNLMSLVSARAEEAKVTESATRVIDICREYAALIKKHSYNTCDYTSAAGKTEKLNWVKHKAMCLTTGKAVQTTTKKVNEFGAEYDKEILAQIKNFKAATFAVQASAFELFSADGTEWKKFAFEGQIQSDKRTLINKNQTACTVSGKGIKLLADNQVSLKILDLKDVGIKLDKVVGGVSIKATLRSEVAQSSEDAGTNFAVDIKCTHTSLEHFNPAKIITAFGKALLVEIKK